MAGSKEEKKKRKRGGIYKVKTFYQFDLEGKQIAEFETIEQAATVNKTDDHRIRKALKRTDCFRRKSYFSYDKNFKPPVKIRSSNVLHATKGRIYGGGLFLKDSFGDEEDDD